MVKYIDNDFLITNKKIYNIEYSFVRWFKYLSAIVVLLYIVGFFTIKPDGFVEINFVFKFLLVLFLLYCFIVDRKRVL